MTTVRKYLSAVIDGRVVLTKADGTCMSPEEQAWINETLTRQLRTDAMVAARGYTYGALSEPDIEVGITLKTGKPILVHPLIHQLKELIKKRDWTLASVSKRMGKHDKTLSEWLRGLVRPTLQDAAKAYAAIGYHLVPVPVNVESLVQKIVQQGEAELMKPIRQMRVYSVPIREED